MEKPDAPQYSDEFHRMERDFYDLEDLWNRCHPAYGRLLRDTLDTARKIKQAYQTLEELGGNK